MLKRLKPSAMPKKLKETVKNIPVVGAAMAKVFKALKPKAAFTTSAKYWEERYRSGGTSGAGSYRELAEFKAEVLNGFVGEQQVQSVIEFGCGDGNQLRYFNFDNYLGFDVSPSALSICREIHGNDQSKRFALMTDYAGEKAELTLSLDVIFHLIEEDVYQHYMAQLFNAAGRYVVIYSSDVEGEQTTAAGHFMHRKFTNWVKENAAEFRLMQRIPNKYPFNGDGETTSVSDFYFYERI